MTYKIIFALFCLTALVLTTNAQTPAPDEVKQMDFIVGFSWRRAALNVNDKIPVLNTTAIKSQLNKTEDFGKGFTAAATYNFSASAGVKVDFSYNVNRRNLFVGANKVELKERLATALLGVETKNNKQSRGLRPFAQALGGLAVGRTRTDKTPCAAAFGTATGCPERLNDTKVGLAAALGAGLDVKLSRQFALRLIQIDYTPVRLNGRTNHGVRFSSGLVF